MQPVDYDSLLNPTFNLTVYVEDTDMEHVDVAYVELRVTDANDNAPVFSPNQQRITIPENVSVATTLFQFSVNDRDTGINKQFRFVHEAFSAFCPFDLQYFMSFYASADRPRAMMQLGVMFSCLLSVRPSVRYFVSAIYTVCTDGFLQTFVIRGPWVRDELIRLWVKRAKVKVTA